MDVRDLQYPVRPLIHLEVEHLIEYLPGSVVDGKIDLDQCQAYLDDLSRHRVTILQSYGARAFGLGTSRDDGSFDMSVYDELFDRALAARFVRFETNESVSATKAARDSAYLRSRCLPPGAIWMKNRDEQPADQFPGMVEEARTWTKAGWNVFSTFNNVFASGQQTRYLAPYYRAFQGGLTSREDYRKRLAAGDLDFANEVWRYNGWGASFLDYAQRLNVGWLQAAMGLDGHHIHVYYRWGGYLDAVVRPDAEKPPLDSVAFEAARDAIEAASLYRLAQYQVMELEEAGLAEQAVARARESMSRIIGDGDALINRTRQQSGFYYMEDIRTPTIMEHYRARHAVLKVLEDLAPHAARIKPDLYWGTQEIVSDGVPDFSVTGDAKAKAYMERLLQDTFGTDPARADSKPRYNIFLGTDPDLAPGRYHFDASNPWNWILRGGDEAGLQQGIRNLTALMTPYSIRRIVTYRMPVPEF